MTAGAGAGRPAGEILLALGGGVLWGLCFGARPLGVAAWIALAPLVLLLGARRPARLAFAHGLAYWLTSIYWIAATLESYGGLPRWLALVLLVALAAFLALYSAAFGWAGAAIWRRGGLLALLALPALWVALEWLRGFLFGGFPWNLAAYAWVEVPGALPLASWIGAWGISYLLVLANVGWALSVSRRSWRTGVAVSLSCALLLALGGRFGSRAAAWGPAGAPIDVRVQQPNIENLVTWDARKVSENYDGLMAQARLACDAPGTLLVWPESAAWPYGFYDHAFLRHDVESLARAGCAVLFNTTVEAGEKPFNSALLVTAGGVAGRYDKRHLVPWGEYVPLARWLPFVGKLARNAGDYAAGGGVGLLPFGEARIGAAICFEVIFPQAVVEQVRQGAGLLAVVSNDAWYGDTSAPWQLLRAARFRAAENRRHLLRAAITGVSAIVAPDGSLEARAGVGERAVLAGRVAARRDLSPFARLPWAVPLLCAVGAGFAIFRARGGKR